VWVQKTEDTEHKVSTLVRTFPDTWEDLNGNFELDANEEGKTWQLAVAVEMGEGEEAGRAIVVGDVNLLSDPLYLQLAGTKVFANDTILWLVGDEDLAGEINTEEDTKIVHTRDEDQAWFWMTVAGVPFLILGLGLVLVRRRDGGLA
jgi:LPXTG-motif cell wall-anchored protein